MCEFSHCVKLTSQMEKLEAVQYSAALAVTGAWTEKNYQGLPYFIGQMKNMEGPIYCWKLINTEKCLFVLIFRQFGV